MIFAIALATGTWASPAAAACPDDDADGVCNQVDNCSDVANAGQTDAEGDGVGDACDQCPTASGAAEDACLGIGIWQSFASTGLERGEGGLAVVGSKIYIIGGEQTAAGRDVQIYDVLANTYSTGPMLPAAGPDGDQGRNHFQPVVIAGRIYVAGGETTTYREPLDELLMLDTSNLGAGWQQLAPLPEPRGAMGCAAYATEIYCGGGTVSENSIPLPPSDAFLSYDSETNQWQTLPSMPRAREHAFAHVIGDHYYVIGGRYLGVNDTVPHTDIYDIGAGTWSEGAPPPLARGGYASAVLQNRILVIAGELEPSAGGNANGVLQRVDEYDPARDTWRSLAQVPTGRHGFMGAVSRAAGGTKPVLYTIAGGIAQGYSGSTVNEGFRFSTCSVSADCNDANPCTNDTCVAGGCQYANNSSACNDGLYCNGTDTCASGGCNSHAGNPCSDGLFCNGSESCNAATGCQAGDPPSTSDGIACTVDACNEAADSITHTPSNALCDDGAFCNGSESCNATTGCQAGTAPSTGDGITCTVDACNEAADSITHAPSNALCDDGAFCNGSESCNTTTDCQAGTAPSTSDGIACTVDACNETTDSITHTPSNALCDDGAFCNGSESCNASTGCTNGPAPCADPVACTVDVCNETDDACSHAPSDATCDDGSFCSGAESCDQVAGCQNVGGEPDCSSLDSVCAVGTCDDASAGCIATPVADGTSCDDGLTCTDEDACASGVCTGQSLCDAVCERCDPQAGQCTPLCAVPYSRGDQPLASDALMILLAVTGVGTCELCLCDLDGNYQLNATDALADLRLAIGLTAPRDCPPGEGMVPPGSTVTTSTTLVTP